MISGKNVSLDEFMTLWYGCLIFRQNIKINGINMASNVINIVPMMEWYLFAKSTEFLDLIMNITWDRLALLS